ncbi:hypothetical protein ABIC63_000504 [Pseudacidovorax sp. 1753]|uniref:hypothetical protein n=1 Tax=Pseudacidovorax sp. 1753 TaxID=3156419 RepID=UPI0033980DB2
MASIEIPVPGQPGRTRAQLPVVLLDPATGEAIGTATPLPVSLVGGSAGVDREVVLTTYVVKTAFAGASVGDTITCVRVLNVSTSTPTTDASIWRNDSTNTDLGAAPSAANLTLVGAGGATETTLAALNTAFGKQDDAVAASDTGTFSFMSFFKRLVQQVVVLVGKFPASLGAKTAATSLSVTPASDANVGRELYTVTSISVSTPAAGGSGFATFPAQACTALEIINTRSDAVDIEYNRGSGPSVPIPAGYTRLIDGITNASQIGVRRRDQVATAVTVIAEARAVA